MYPKLRFSEKYQTNEASGNWYHHNPLKMQLKYSTLTLSIFYIKAMRTAFN